MDVIGLSLVTMGAKASLETQRLFEAGEYTKYLYLHGLSVETAEALAEYLHKKMRQELGIAGEDSPHIRDLFHQKYRGSRYSFGYPAGPNLEDQTTLFALLKPEENVGVRITTGFWLDRAHLRSWCIIQERSILWCRYSGAASTRCSSAARTLSANTSGLHPERLGCCRWFAEPGGTRWWRVPAVR
jgi:hypothetical protein